MSEEPLDALSVCVLHPLLNAMSQWMRDPLSLARIRTLHTISHCASSWGNYTRPKKRASKSKSKSESESESESERERKKVRERVRESKRE